MSKNLRRRIVREGEGMPPSSASLLVHLPGAADGGEPVGFNDLLASLRRQGYDEGYRVALEEVAAAEAASRSVQLRRVVDSLAAAAAAMAEARLEAMQLVANEAAELAYQLAESFLQRELVAGPGAIEAVARAIHLVPEGHDVIVRLHPGDSLSPEEVQPLVPEAAVKVVADPQVEPGGCVVVAGPCRVDSQLGPALERAREVLDELYPTLAPTGAPTGAPTLASSGVATSAPTGAAVSA
ncbi:MAG: hypothetical protein KGQ66_15195 [Acidobacteriota bacterium]|nr:hypothetical protein [Acidobacteriota bacterium]